MSILNSCRNSRAPELKTFAYKLYDRLAERIFQMIILMPILSFQDLFASVWKFYDCVTNFGPVYNFSIFGIIIFRLTMSSIQVIFL